MFAEAVNKGAHSTLKRLRVLLLTSMSATQVSNTVGSYKVGNSSLENTNNKQVLPHPPSPTITSFFWIICPPEPKQSFSLEGMLLLEVEVDDVDLIFEIRYPLTCASLSVGARLFLWLPLGFLK